VRLEEKPFADVTKADIEAVREWRRRTSKGGAKGGEVGINRLLSRLRHLCNWAIVEGYRIDTPFRSGPVSVIRVESSVEGARTRRLDSAGDQNEERRLLDHADPHLRAVLVAALLNGLPHRRDSSLQWSQIRRDANGEARWFELPAAKTKTDKARVVPIGDRLRAELSMRRHAADGREHPSDAHVFGDEAGAYYSYDRLRRLWEDAVLRAHGHTSVRVRGKLTAESRAAYRAVGLHLHDFRREFASRLLEASADLHDVPLFLGHANITTKHLSAQYAYPAEAGTRQAQGRRVRTLFGQRVGIGHVIGARKERR
jgi:integrase